MYITKWGARREVCFIKKIDQECALGAPMLYQNTKICVSTIRQCSGKVKQDFGLYYMLNKGEVQ